MGGQEEGNGSGEGSGYGRAEEDFGKGGIEKSGEGGDGEDDDGARKTDSLKTT